MTMNAASGVMASTTPIGNATSKKELERRLIRSLAGCYTVTFKFTETFSPDEGYNFRDRYMEQAQEYAFVLEETEDKISIQHILYAGPRMLIKHWRQDWIYENREFLTLANGHQWKKTQVPPEAVKGTWTQKVFQVDDTPRYQGYGTWIHADNRHFWQSFSDAPIPRRDSKKRSDYNVLKRRSHVEIFEDDGWVIDQDNIKIVRSDDGVDTVLCEEKGIERLTPKDFDPQRAIDFFEPQRAFWADVREIWAAMIERNDRIEVSEHKKLYTSQFRLAEKFSGDAYDADAAKTAVRELFAAHVTLG